MIMLMKIIIKKTKTKFVSEYKLVEQLMSIGVTKCQKKNMSKKYIVASRRKMLKTS